MRKFLIAAALLSLGSLAHAECACVCAGGQVQAICRNAFDLKPICAPQICPLAPPSIAPIQTPYIPPLGTQSCRPVQVWNGFAYVWQTICR